MADGSRLPAFPFSAPCERELEHHASIVADLLQRGHEQRASPAIRRRAAGDRRSVPGCRARARATRCSETVSISIDDVAFDVCVAEVEANRRSARIQHLLRQSAPAMLPWTARWGSSSTAIVTPSGLASVARALMLRLAASRLLSPGACCCERTSPACTTRTRKRQAPGDLECAGRLLQRVLPARRRPGSPGSTVRPSGQPRSFPKPARARIPARGPTARAIAGGQPSMTRCDSRSAFECANSSTTSNPLPPISRRWSRCSR